ncbi:MAG: 3-deoxy-7-phosphoheptulonate synthase [Spirochaetales bacterium]|nr:MAG: 3-deoxy-7-phosphoheptulonate synthase [Spirochaetales bacterium]
MTRLAELPPIVFPSEVDQLTTQIALAAEGKQFILHGGDCVERFIDCNQQTITNKLKILLQMSVILAHAARRPVLRVGRIAGQFFKPRTTDVETVDGREVPTYKGDTINGFSAEERTPDPGRLVQGYFHATATLNYIRSMIDGGFADLHHPYSWNLLGMEQTAKWPDYQSIIERILDAIHFMVSFGGINRDSLGRIDFYTSHEGLHLGYETALTRHHQEAWYNLGAHLLWIGERTRQLDGAHVEYFRGIRNPVGVKLSSRAKPGEIRELCQTLNPQGIPGKLVLITRLGASQVESALPAIIEGVSESGVPVAWVCDPMHGNTRTTGSGRKTRDFADVLEELERTFEVHRAAGSILAGVHFELTGDDVTECTGGALELREGDLELNYQTYCDPRLNYAQGMEMAFLISRFLR